MTSSPAIDGWLDGLAHEHPDSPAILVGGRITSWSSLDAMASRVAARVARHGTVALLAAPSASAIAILHAAFRGGFRLLPINARAAPPEIARLIAAAGASLFVVDGERASTPTVPAGVDVIALDDLVSAGADRLGPEHTNPGEVLVPTSGTTGTPRIARLTAANVEASASAWSEALPPATGWLLSLGLAHVAGIGIVVRAARDGVPLVIPDGADPAAVLEAIDRAHLAGIDVSHLSLVATQLGRLLDYLADAPPPRSIRAVLLGGGPIPPSLVSRAVRAGWPIVPTYGMTETASGVTALPAADAPAHPSSAGRALPGVELRVGDQGELQVRGPMVFAGYVGDGAATAAAIDPDGWLRTGDVARISHDGLVHIVDRLDDLIISGAENIAPAEVEATLLEHPDVDDAGVIGVSDPTWGRVPVAVVVPRASRTLAIEDLLAFARSRLASFKVPTRVVIVDELPRSPSGKLLRRELAPLITPGAPSDGTRGIRLAVVDRPGPSGAPTVVLLHATLASAASLSGLAAELAGDARAIALDRRGSGGTPLVPAEPVSISVHVADLRQALTDAGVNTPVILVGHSFGGVVALEFAARHPNLVAAVLAWEPPYLALADAPMRDRFAGLADEITLAHSTRGAVAAAETFYTAVTGPGTWVALPTRLRAAIGAAGDGALADAAMPDLDPEGLDRIATPVVIATGDRNDPLYAPIADALVARIPAARRVNVAGLEHMAPITDPKPIARLVREMLARIATQEPSS